MIRIVIADDHPEIRSAWSMFLRSHANIIVVGECTNGQEVIDKVRESQPDIVLMDINMKPISGIEATRKLTDEHPDVKVIGVSFHTSPVYIRKMLDAGARGYVFKYAVVEDLLNAIEEVYKGNIFLGKDVKPGN
ncbi:response regulator transcription factor [Agriterribacter sp.]|uniref:response regulator n=1 Tax=Agriterribacter sp. TaxID=2821509 RepID=UPI002BA649D3|nr:response regulator transcription factor [Agriterribacter sp.]HRO45134.1 response regulator transcription factor [Agriterribacter sp.]